MEKVRLPRIIIDAIELMKAKGSSLSEIVERHIKGNLIEVDGYKLVDSLTTDTLIRALYIGYEVELTPEDKVREWYQGLRTQLDSGVNGHYSEQLVRELTTIDKCIKLLNIKIEGVNA